VIDNYDPKWPFSYSVLERIVKICTLEIRFREMAIRFRECPFGIDY
jgi:hypothetical protein